MNANTNPNSLTHCLDKKYAGLLNGSLPATGKKKTNLIHAAVRWELSKRLGDDYLIEAEDGKTKIVIPAYGKEPSFTIDGRAVHLPTGTRFDILVKVPNSCINRNLANVANHFIGEVSRWLCTGITEKCYFVAIDIRPDYALGSAIKKGVSTRVIEKVRHTNLHLSRLSTQTTSTQDRVITMFSTFETPLAKMCYEEKKDIFEALAKDPQTQLTSFTKLEKDLDHLASLIRQKVDDITK